ncbi:MAG: hypothetical protein GY696_28410 [Gammaproteobacteria bacterium]|nr:hypothetical protein [Gammaproteobacteria bacterium]
MYRIKPYDTNSLHQSITAHIGRLKKSTLDSTERFMPPGLRTDPDEELEEMELPQDPNMPAVTPPPRPAYVATPQLRARRFIEPPGGRPALPEEKRNRPPRVIPRPRGTRNVGQLLRCQLPAWQEEEAEEEEDQPGSEPHEDMEEGQDHLEPPCLQNLAKNRCQRRKIWIWTWIWKLEARQK